MGRRPEREEQIEELVGGQNPGPEAPPSGAMGKGGCVRVVEAEEVRGNDPVEYFLLTGVGSTSGVPEGVMAVEDPRMKRFLEVGRMEGEKESVLPSVGEERIGGGRTH